MKPLRSGTGAAQIDQSTDFSAGEPAGELSHALADVLLGCMEVMMEDLVEEVAGAGGGLRLVFCGVCVDAFGGCSGQAG